MPRPPALYNRRKWQLIGKSQWCGSAMLQLQHTSPPPINHTRPSPRKHSPDGAARVRKQTSDYSLLLSYRPRKDERLSRPGWLVTYRNKVPPPGVEPGRVTHPSTNRARRIVTSLIRPTPLPLTTPRRHRRVIGTRVCSIEWCYFQ